LPMTRDSTQSTATKAPAYIESFFRRDMVSVY
jgi:hypothetical protein